MRPELRTPRFRLRPVDPDDRSWIAALNADPEVMRFIPSDVSPPAGCDPHFGLWAVEEITAEVHGWGALKPLGNEVEVGFRLRRSFWGQGIATETGLALLAYGFDVLRLERIIGVSVVGNVASERVLAKLGLHLERRIVFDGVEWNNFALTRAEWDGSQAVTTAPYRRGSF